MSRGDDHPFGCECFACSRTAAYNDRIRIVPCPSCASKDRTIALLKAVAEAAEVRANLMIPEERTKIHAANNALHDALEAAKKGGAL